MSCSPKEDEEEDEEEGCVGKRMKMKPGGKTGKETLFVGFVAGKATWTTHKHKYKINKQQTRTINVIYWYVNDYYQTG